MIRRIMGETCQKEVVKRKGEPMNKHVLIWMLGLLTLAPVLAASADEQINLKLVLAKKTKDGTVDNRLNDVKDLLKNNLPYNSYTLLGQTTVPLKDTDRIILAAGVTVTLADVKERTLNLRINQEKKKVLSARVNLRKGKPAVLGGFSGNDGKMMVIVTLL